MKPRFLTMAICTFALFSVDLTYGHYPVSPYAYANNNPVRFVDPDGRDWYSYDEEYEDEEGNKKTRTRYEYREERMSNKELEAGCYKHLGYTFTDKQTGTYYSLLGDQLDGSSKEGRIWQGIDQAIINMNTFEPDPWYPDGTEVSTNFDGIIPYSKDRFGSYNNTHRLSRLYGGSTVFFQVYETTMKGKYVPPTGKTFGSPNYMGAKLPSAYYGYIRVNNSSVNNIVYMAFPNSNALAHYQNRINKLFPKK